MANEFNNFQLSFEVPRAIQNLILTHTLLDNVIARSFLTLNSEISERNPMGLPFKWNLSGIGFPQYCSFLTKRFGRILKVFSTGKYNDCT